MEDIYDFKRIKTNVYYNEAKLKITEIRRKDNKMISRKKLKKLCNQFLTEVKEKYPDADGLISVSIKYSNRWYSGDVSNFHKKKIFFHLMIMKILVKIQNNMKHLDFNIYHLRKQQKGVKMNIMIVL